eukprot:CAMPEP_0174386624 /NCGR_PEP_ID=MMETSP0811_2-20130205/127401_1 /TAXON_ID=73025 ORGANISM="Eutreptiella gymnastica-like, Strain CCMP1594" /NCGR_SAMPLE_ID=MMETSP0811_2 /ASSEMBLY_ACC=CAM_ASM_000667 /LENGTH=109 /DNA_ID=CAMNT_0015541359 /DNA_START=368 /DNA_END=697 /DNA_ORIENTATION=-
MQTATHWRAPGKLQGSVRQVLGAVDEMMQEQARNSRAEEEQTGRVLQENGGLLRAPEVNGWTKCGDGGFRQSRAALEGKGGEGAGSVASDSGDWHALGVGWVCKVVTCL